MRIVSAREANRGFSKLLRAVGEGEEILITRRGKPVARLSGVDVAADDKERRAEIDCLIAQFREGIDLGEPVRWTRDELYDRCG